MRRLRQGEYNQWFLGDRGDVRGIDLGYYECGDHESGFSGIGHALGVVGDCKVTKCPDNLFLQKFTYYDDEGQVGHPAGALLLHPDPDETWIAGFSNPATTRQALAHCGDFRLWPDPADRWFEERRDFACCWNPDAFGVVVRGEANVKRLEELYAAFQRCDIAIELGSVGGLIFRVLSHMSEETRVRVLAADTAARARNDAARDDAVSIARAWIAGRIDLSPVPWPRGTYGDFGPSEDYIVFIVPGPPLVLMGTHYIAVHKVTGVVHDLGVIGD